jgi:hypothetical protein
MGQGRPREPKDRPPHRAPSRAPVAEPHAPAAEPRSPEDDPFLAAVRADAWPLLIRF